MSPEDVLLFSAEDNDAVDGPAAASASPIPSPLAGSTSTSATASATASPSASPTPSYSPSPSAAACDLAGIPTKHRCAEVQANCASVGNLINYLAFYYCSPVPPAVAFILLFLWLLLLISMLATSADFFFVPPLTFLSNYLKLSPATAGITLLALGNGAPDVFGAIAGIDTANDFQIVVGALLGASIFISSVVFGSVILVSKEKHGGPRVNKPEFIRDVVAYIITTISIFIIASDGTISIWESLSLLGLYAIYVAFVVVWTRKASRAGHVEVVGDVDKSMSGSVAGSVLADQPTEGSALLPRSASSSINAMTDPTEGGKADPLGRDVVSKADADGNEPMAGLTWQGDMAWYEKLQFLAEYPFSILRWATTPTCDGFWNLPRRLFLMLSLPGCGLVFLLDGAGWDGFTAKVGAMPTWAVIVLIGSVLSAIAWWATDNVKEPKWAPILYLMGFSTTVAWMDLQANEAVALMESMGLVFGINTAILGLTVLAIGNSVGDLVADTAVARNGQPKMGMASCFGSPLLNDILGLGISLTVTTVKNYPEPFHGKLNTQLYVAWGFLFVSLFSALLTMGFNGFKAPRWLSFGLYGLYFAFMVVSVVLEVKS